MDFEKEYKEEALQYINIVKRFGAIQENDIKGAYRLMLDSLQAYNRWSKIKLDIKKDLGRGEKAALKDRLEEICKYLKEVHITSRMIWNKAKDDLNNNKEF
ncbi:MAG: hypothetical protein SOX50_08780 [Terrisporobacter othiniensis]|uniref:hypothetical protein n=1 Tax=Terrisporobacter othiniensis TaxID=1577792 RepID=UPI002A75491A|nr:hypothetical protein [Terrisporobacter othiniensis]MDY3373353.1 hypothetical protein [Terrisporobacter othiniensis]